MFKAAEVERKVRQINLKMYACAKLLEGNQIMGMEKMRLKSHRVYPPEIIQTTSLGRLQKKLLELNDCLYVVSVS